MNTIDGRNMSKAKNSGSNFKLGVGWGHIISHWQKCFCFGLIAHSVAAQVLTGNIKSLSYRSAREKRKWLALVTFKAVIPAMFFHRFVLLSDMFPVIAMNMRKTMVRLAIFHSPFKEHRHSLPPPSQDPYLQFHFSVVLKFPLPIILKTCLSLFASSFQKAAFSSFCFWKAT